MAIIKFANTKPSLKKLIEYVSNVEKTGYISGKDCMAISCYEEMIATKMLYKKEDGRQQLHLIQSFDIKDKVEPKLAHDIGMELAKYFKGHQVLVATHTDKEHIHNHLVINSVNFENGKKINLSKKDLEKIKEYSNKLCKEKDLSVIETKSKVKDFKQNEYRVALKGESWKFKLINAIDYSMERSRNKYQFIDQMNRLGYGVNWSKNRKHITYITPENMKCRDIRLHETKYLKEEMEKYYRRFKEQKFNTNDREQIYSNKGRHSRTYIGQDGREFVFGNVNGKRHLGKDKVNRYDKNERIYYRKIRNKITKDGARKTEYERGENSKENKNDILTSRSNNSINNSSIYTLLGQIGSFGGRKNTPVIKGWKKNLSKQAMKEYAKNKANSSMFNWEEEME